MPWTDGFCNHNYYVGQPVTDDDRDRFFQIINSQCLRCNLEVEKRHLALMRKQNMVYLKHQKSRMQNIDLLRHDATSIQALRDDAMGEIRKLIKVWMEKVRTESIRWDAEYGTGKDKGPGGQSIFLAEEDYIMTLQF